MNVSDLDPHQKDGPSSALAITTATVAGLPATLLSIRWCQWRHVRRLRWPGVGVGQLRRALGPQIYVRDLVTAPGVSLDFGEDGDGGRYDSE